MTRASLNQTLRWSYVLLTAVLALSLVAKLADQIPDFAGSPLGKIGSALYDYLKDMALVFITVVAAYLANVFQKRSKFIESLEEEWRRIVRTKTQLLTYCERPNANLDDYLAAFFGISEAIDNMRIVYRNVGETDSLVGLYPYVPLHDMRRALQSIDPRRNLNVTPEQKALVRHAILQGFYALREVFLDELDLEAPTRPLLAASARRSKVSGWTRAAGRAQKRELHHRARKEGARPDVDIFLRKLIELEEQGRPSADYHTGVPDDGAAARGL